ncbi:MAG TPA: tetratricopeptide repeat protein [Bryobacteraceae bacterium]|jgi:tetratricopeptide (TPR) repeat protein|nr:tetratricopeptide repeat protein [Bryobacteraceae bacterium]
MRILYTLPMVAALALGGSLEDQARDLFQRTQYRDSLAVLASEPHKNAAELQIMGQDYFMLGDYKKSTEALEKALTLDPNNARILHWLGRAYGRRAEMANPFTAPGYANKSRQALERSVQLDPANKDATGDLLDYYLDAPNFLGGGMQKAEALADLISKTDPAEGHYARALIDDKRKQYDAAEDQLRRAAELAPKQVGRFIALGKYLAGRGQYKESDAMFDQAARLAPDNPQLLFERASVYVKARRNLGEARELLEKYLRAPLTPDDPPREQAEALLRKIGAGS